MYITTFTELVYKQNCTQAIFTNISFIWDFLDSWASNKIVSSILLFVISKVLHTSKSAYKDKSQMVTKFMKNTIVYVHWVSARINVSEAVVSRELHCYTRLGIKINSLCSCGKTRRGKKTTTKQKELIACNGN